MVLALECFVLNWVVCCVLETADGDTDDTVVSVAVIVAGDPVELFVIGCAVAVVVKLFVVDSAVAVVKLFVVDSAVTVVKLFVVDSAVTVVSVAVIVAGDPVELFVVGSAVAVVVKLFVVDSAVVVAEVVVLSSARPDSKTMHVACITVLPDSQCGFLVRQALRHLLLSQATRSKLIELNSFDSHAPVSDGVQQSHWQLTP